MLLDERLDILSDQATTLGYHDDARAIEEARKRIAQLEAELEEQGKLLDEVAEVRTREHGEWSEDKEELQRLREVEHLASIFHDAWVHWAEAILEEEDISPERTKRWIEYFIPYDMLSEDVKEFDREWARKAAMRNRDA